MVDRANDVLKTLAKRVGDPVAARHIVQHVCQCTSAEVLTKELSNDDYVRVMRLADEYCAGKPLQYLLGEWGFFGLTLKVNEHVLIPRPETECLVDALVATVSTMQSAPTIVDLGTGSGAIALAVRSALPNAVVVATDVSDAALETARHNCEALFGADGNAVTFLCGSWFHALPDDLRGAVDVLVSNPPYIALNDPYVEPVVSAYEPQQALFSGETGMDALREIITESPWWLRLGGKLFVEHGSMQGPPTAQLFRDAGFVDVQTNRDLAGRDRFTVGTYGGSSKS